MYRIWSDEESCFVPVAPEDYEEILRETQKEKDEKKNLERDKEKGRKLADIVWTQINAIQDFAKWRGRTPSVRELGNILDYLSSNIMQKLAFYWGHDNRRKDNIFSHKEALDNLYRVAGFERVDGRRTYRQRTMSRESGTLGARLTEKRLELNLTQEQVSESVNRTRNVISLLYKPNR